MSLLSVLCINSILWKLRKQEHVYQKNSNWLKLLGMYVTLIKFYFIFLLWNFDFVTIIYRYTLGGFFLASYEDSPVGVFDEVMFFQSIDFLKQFSDKIYSKRFCDGLQLVVIAGLVWNRPTSCAYVLLFQLFICLFIYYCGFIFFYYFN